VLVAAGIMGVVVWFTHGALEIYVPGSAATAQLVRLGVSILVGVICYVAMVFVLRVPEATSIAETARNIFRRIFAKARAYSDARKQV
jgi:peptidoglycan biosynthesis protein MviN/MurJ (putative lipid II flippase)